MKKNSIKVGLIQQASSQNYGENLDKIILEIKRLASMGAELITLQELHNSIYFCQAEDPSIFDLAETIPDKSTEILSSVAADNKVVIVSSLFEKRAPGLYHNTAVVLKVMAVLLANTEKCIFQMIPLIMRSFILHQEIWVLNLFKRV